MKNGLKKILEDLSGELPGLVVSAVVLIEDGLSVAELSTNPNIEAGPASAYLASIVKSNLKAIKLLAGEQITDDILITTDHNYFLIRHIAGKPLFLFVMTRKDEWLGRARLLMKKCEKTIIEILDSK